LPADRSYARDVAPAVRAGADHSNLAATDIQTDVISGGVTRAADGLKIIRRDKNPTRGSDNEREQPGRMSTFAALLPPPPTLPTYNAFIDGIARGNYQSVARRDATRVLSHLPSPFRARFFSPAL